MKMFNVQKKKNVLFQQYYGPEFEPYCNQFWLALSKVRI
jgi:hypothetical protein